MNKQMTCGKFYLKEKKHYPNSVITHPFNSLCFLCGEPKVKIRRQLKW